MIPDGLNIVVCGLSITSSWGNGHATTYRALLKALNERGHRIHFLERDVPWYKSNRDMRDSTYCRISLYESLDELCTRFEPEISRADAIIIGSYVPDGIEIGSWIREVSTGPVCFYDIDTPVTLAKLATGDFEYLSPGLVRSYDRYFSFSGGPVLQFLEQEYGSPSAHALYCSADLALYQPLPKHAKRWLLGYLGTYSFDRQFKIQELLLEPARHLQEERFIVAGPGYPDIQSWPANVESMSHLPPLEHCTFYNSQHFCLNVTRSEMIRVGFSPSVRIFEAAACGVPVISDYWQGLDSFFKIGEEILIAESAEECTRLLADTSAEERKAIGRRARARMLAEHSPDHRARQLEEHLMEAMVAKPKKTRPAASISSSILTAK